MDSGARSGQRGEAQRLDNYAVDSPRTDLNQLQARIRRHDRHAPPPLNEFSSRDRDGIVIGMELGFSGEVADLYHRYRHGYPGAVIDALAGGAFKLTGQDVTVDLGCGTGQLTLPMARQVRAVIGVDVEQDMHEHARQAALDADVRNVIWMLGADTNVPALRPLLGDRSVGVVTIAQALHWMNHEGLFRAGRSAGAPRRRNRCNH